MMHKPVRYYITESDDRPIIRAVPVTVRFESLIDTQPRDPLIDDSSSTAKQSRRSRLRSRLKSPRSSGGSQ